MTTSTDSGGGESVAGAGAAPAAGSGGETIPVVRVDVARLHEPGVFAAFCTLLTRALAGECAVLPLAQERLAAAGTLEVPDRVSDRVPDRVSAGVALLIATSGSTGQPKLVAVTAAALRASVAGSRAALGGEGAWLVSLPLTGIAGVLSVVRSLSAGHPPTLGHAGQFRAERWVDEIAGMPGPVFSALVPAQLLRVVELLERERALSSRCAALAAVLVGGQACPPELRLRAERLGLRVVGTYGGTETCGGCVYDGVPLPGVTIRLHGGEVWVAGATLARGYLGDTVEHPWIESEGMRWYRSGDLGSLVAGLLTVTGRRDRVIVSGGVNVALDRLELHVRACPGFETAVVVPVAHERWGESSVVVCEGALDDGARVAARAALKAHLVPLFGVAWVPDAVLALPRLPLTPSGKPDRQYLRQWVQAQRR